MNLREKLMKKILVRKERKTKEMSDVPMEIADYVKDVRKSLEKENQELHLNVFAGLYNKLLKFKKVSVLLISPVCDED